ncbi:MAG TPA: hypothetical protein VGN95_01625 [Pyrinomonadaceae bacterium]|jgi:predicted RNase H-like nuclease|nr:hypothetical protein [Pyrinomonadaceae bacterium]
MDFIGIDLHKTSSQVCILSEDGELTERRIKSTRASFDEMFAARPQTRILVEASTESLRRIGEKTGRDTLRDMAG